MRDLVVPPGRRDLVGQRGAGHDGLDALRHQASRAAASRRSMKRQATRSDQPDDQHRPAEEHPSSLRPAQIVRHPAVVLGGPRRPRHQRRRRLVRRARAPRASRPARRASPARPPAAPGDPSGRCARHAGASASASMIFSAPPSTIGRSNSSPSRSTCSAVSMPMKNSASTPARHRPCPRAIASSIPVTAAAEVRPTITVAASARASTRGAHLADALLQAQQLGPALAVAERQHRVLDRQRRDARRLELLDRAPDVQRVAIAVVGVDHEGQRGGARHAPALVGELGQRQHDQVGRAQHRQRGRRAADHADLEADILGQPDRERVEDRGRHQAPPLGQMRAKPLAPRAVHVIPLAIAAPQHSTPRPPC